MSLRTALAAASAIFAPALALCWLSACELPPRFVKESSEIDGYIMRKSWASACVGLKMKNDDGLRRYTSERLAGHPHVRAATSCVCEALYSVDGRAVDYAVADGLAGSRRDDLAECLAPALDDGSIVGPDRANLVRVLGGIDASAAYALLEKLAVEDDDPTVRAHATRALKPSLRSTELLVERLANDEAAVVRAAAAEALTDRKEKAVHSPLIAAATSDVDGQVRAAALGAVVKLKHAKRDEIVCNAMLDDSDAQVRDAAVRAYHGSKRKSALKCLEKRLLTEEESTTVRSSVLAALGASPSDLATDILCDSIGPFLKLYVKDAIAETLPAVNILETQNNRDWERSLECAERALARGGYSCYARNHLGHWIKRLGGKAATPWCPGMERE